MQIINADYRNDLNYRVSIPYSPYKPSIPLSFIKKKIFFYYIINTSDSLFKHLY